MHLKSKQVAWCGIIMAFTVILQIASGIIETSSLFLLAAASFLAGCVERKFGTVTALGFSIGAFILGVILAPQKLYCFTFAGFCVYVLVAEYFRQKDRQAANAGKTFRKSTEYIIKGILYHIMLIAALVISFTVTGLDVIFSKNMIEKAKDMPVFIIIILGALCAEFLWLVFDRAYIFFQDRYGLIVCGRED